MKKYLLETTVFVAGAIVMILELVAARVLSPYVGSSNLVWTSVIGVILLSMSLGYAFGGKLADKAPNRDILSSIIVISAVFVSAIPIMELLIIRTLATYIDNLTVSAVLSSLLVFTIPCVLLATVSPYAIKLKESNSEKIGETAGRLSAFSTLGSIVGTFSAGFYLIPTFGNKTIILVCAVILLVLAIFLKTNKKVIEWVAYTAFLAVVITLVCLGKWLFGFFNPHVIADVDTEYSRLWIAIMQDKDKNRVKALLADTAIESYTDANGDMGAKYLYYYDLFNHYNSKAEKTLLIGGAAYTYPMYYLENFENKLIDVVEIDPKMTEIAKSEFGLIENERMRIYHEDGRSFINKCKGKYDAVLIDAFKGMNVPFELTTVECLTKVKNLLNDDGVVIANVISSLEGRDSYFVQAEYATYKKVFPEVKLFAVTDVSDKEKRQNLILIGFNSKNMNKDDEGVYEEYLKNEVKDFKCNEMELTDDYAPVEKYF